MSSLASLPSVDRLLRSDRAPMLIERYGRAMVAGAIRAVLADIRASAAVVADEIALLQRVQRRLDSDARPSLRPVFNLTGTVLHTNLGRAPLPEQAIAAVAVAARGASNLEFNLAEGLRGDRDEHIERQLCRLTGAEAATCVNNNAAAVLLVLNTLASRKEVPTSRGELIEIGGSFRMPDIMLRAGCRLREVGTTNRVHLRDYEEAIGARTGAVLKVHTSNYAIVGFTSSVPEAELARVSRARGVPFVVDLGSGSLIDLAPYGLPHEPTVAEAIANGADVVTFSGDKLLGGPQAGLIVGRAELIDRIKRNPLKRALRLDKMTIAALSSVLALYGDPDRLAQRLPVLRLLTRPVDEIRGIATRLQPAVAAALGDAAAVEVVACDSQVGSGAQPTAMIASAGLAVTVTGRRGSGAMLKKIAAAFRALPIPVIGRVQDDTFILDVRCLDDEAGFVAQLTELTLQGAGPT